MFNSICKFKSSGTVTINGVDYVGGSVVISNGDVTIDGKIVSDITNTKIINITIEGSTGDIDLKSGTVIVKGDCGDISTQSGDVDISNDCKGDVSTMSGDVEAYSILGKVKTMSGDITTKRS